MKKKWRANLTFVQVCMTLAFKLVVSSKNFFKNAFVFETFLERTIENRPDVHLYRHLYTKHHTQCLHDFSELNLFNS